MLQPDETTTLRRVWKIDEPTADLADRIVAHALAHPQQGRWLGRLKVAFNPSPVFAMRGLAVAACLTIAILTLDGGIGGGDKPTRTGTTYKMPMDQIVEDLMWNDYNY